MAEPPVVNQAAFEVAVLTQRMSNQFFAHGAALYVARHPRVEALAPPVEHGQNVPILRTAGGRPYWFNHYIKLAQSPEATTDFDRVWLQGALITLGDALRRHDYFGHIPEAEIIRHLRNAVAHNNRFTFSGSALDKARRSLRYPANIFRYSALQSMPRYEINADMQGEELMWSWGGGGPEPILDCLTTLGVHLWHVAHGLEHPPLE